jgi:hypothetical protein
MNREGIRNLAIHIHQYFIWPDERLEKDEEIMDKTAIISIVLGATGTATGVAGTIMGIVNHKAIKNLQPLQSRMTTVESSVNSILNPTVVVQQAPTAPAAPDATAARQQNP